MLVLCSPASTSLGGIGAGGFTAGDAAKNCNSRQAVQSKTPGRFPAGIQARDDLIIAIDDLTLCVDLQTGQCVMKDWGRPCRVERRFLNFVHWTRLSEF